MSHAEQELFDRLGRDGLTRVLHDLLDSARLVKLANACSLRYPGIRTRSQKRERILEDLIDLAWRQGTTRKAVFRALQKETSAACRSWNRLTTEEKRRRIEELSDTAADGEVGLALYLAARDGSADGPQQGLKRLLARPDLLPGTSTRKLDAEIPKRNRETARLEKKVADNQKKIQRLEARLDRSKEAEKALKRDLLKRQGELAESRMLVERLRRELKQAKGAAQEANAKASRTPTEETLERLTRSLSRLATEQRKLAHGVDKLAARPAAPSGLSAKALEPLQESLGVLHKELAALRRDRRKDAREQGQLLEELRAELRSYKRAVSRLASGAPQPRRKGEPERVGVFIDVQNMYYGARQLKGKLDFDALLRAAVLDRRMIQAKAYVVESKEIDQSGFISVLQQRAIEVRRKTLKVRADRSMKGDWDMEMALDILDAAPKLNVVVLVSGDGDFTSLVNRIKGMGPRVEVIGFPRTTAKSLVEAADRFQPLGREFMIRSESPAKTKR